MSIANSLEWRWLHFLSATLFGFMILANAQAAPEANVILHSTITGNQEQPKVLYIVPWQPPGGVDQLQQPVQSLLNDVFAPVDRAEFQRELKYRAAAENASSPAGATP